MDVPPALHPDPVVAAGLHYARVILGLPTAMPEERAEETPFDLAGALAEEATITKTEVLLRLLLRTFIGASNTPETRERIARVAEAALEIAEFPDPEMTERILQNTSTMFHGLEIGRHHLDLTRLLREKLSPYFLPEILAPYCGALAWRLLEHIGPYIWGRDLICTISGSEIRATLRLHFESGEATTPWGTSHLLDHLPEEWLLPVEAADPSVLTQLLAARTPSGAVVYIHSPCECPPTVRPGPPIDIGPTTACSECPAIFKAEDAYISKRDPNRLLCPACFEAAETGGRAKLVKREPDPTQEIDPARVATRRTAFASACESMFPDRSVNGPAFSQIFSDYHPDLQTVDCLHLVPPARIDDTGLSDEDRCRIARQIETE